MQTAKWHKSGILYSAYRGQVILRANIARDMNLRPKVVVDTNVLVSALRSSLGPSFALMALVRSGAVHMSCSPALFLEYEDVLKRPVQLASFGLTADDIEDILAELAGLVVPVATHYQWRPQLRDPNDEMVLEAAVNAGVKVIATYNLRDFPPAANFGISVLNPEQTLKYFQLQRPTGKGFQP